MTDSPASPARALGGETDPKKAIAAALRLLTARALTAGELAARLEKRGHAGPAVAAALARMAEFGYLDDRRTAQGWAEAAVRLRGLGPRRIRLGLLRRCVGQEIAGEIGAALFSLGEEERLALVAREKWERLHGPAADAARRRRVYAHLLRKGFTGAAARAALSRIQENE